jgi:hypothetical protein
MSKKTPRRRSQASKSPVEVIVAKYGLFGTVITALLGLIGVSLAAYISYLGIRAQIEAPLHATQTAEARQFASTPDGVTLPTAVTPPTNQPTFDLPFTANFDNGGLDGWSTFGGDAKILSGSLVLVTYDEAVTPVGLDTWSNYSLRARIKLVSGEDFGIIVGASDNCSLYQMQFVQGKLSVVRYDGLACPYDYTYVSLYVDPYPMVQNRWYEIRLDFQSPIITGYVNGAKVFSTEDAFYQSGKVGFRVAVSQIFVEDLEVSTISNP